VPGVRGCGSDTCWLPPAGGRVSMSESERRFPASSALQMFTVCRQTLGMGESAGAAGPRPSRPPGGGRATPSHHAIGAARLLVALPLVLGAKARSALARIQLATAPPCAEEQGPRTDRPRRLAAGSAAARAIGDKRDCGPGLIETCLCASAGARGWGRSRGPICPIPVVVRRTISPGDLAPLVAERQRVPTTEFTRGSARNAAAYPGVAGGG
jgi:hypothetical protein